MDKKCCIEFDGVCCAVDLPLDAVEGIAGDDFDNTACVSTLEEYEQYHEAVG